MKTLDLILAIAVVIMLTYLLTIQHIFLTPIIWSIWGYTIGRPAVKSILKAINTQP